MRYHKQDNNVAVKYPAKPRLKQSPMVGTLVGTCCKPLHRGLVSKQWVKASLFVFEMTALIFLHCLDCAVDQSASSDIFKLSGHSTNLKI